MTQGMSETGKDDFKWSTDYGKDLLEDINQLAHTAGTHAVAREILQRTFRELRRLRALVEQQNRALEPFAKEARNYGLHTPDDFGLPTLAYCSVGHLRTARTAYEATLAEGKKQ